jgi:hypothetical protein
MHPENRKNWKEYTLRKMPSSEMLRRVAVVRTKLSDERIATIIKVKRIGDLGTTLAATNDRSTMRRNTM